MEKSEADVGVSEGSDYFGDLRGAGAAKRAGGKKDAGRAEQTHERLSFRVVPSIPTPEPPVPPLAAQFFEEDWPPLRLASLGIKRLSFGERVGLIDWTSSFS